jgi:hypothetical protein
MNTSASRVMNADRRVDVIGRGRTNSQGSVKGRGRGGEAVGKFMCIAQACALDSEGRDRDHAEQHHQPAARLERPNGEAVKAKQRKTNAETPNPKPSSRSTPSTDTRRVRAEGGEDLLGEDVVGEGQAAGDDGGAERGEACASGPRTAVSAPAAWSHVAAAYAVGLQFGVRGGMLALALTCLHHAST